MLAPVVWGGSTPFIEGLRLPPHPGVVALATALGKNQKEFDLDLACEEIQAALGLFGGRMGPDIGHPQLYYTMAEFYLYCPETDISYLCGPLDITLTDTELIVEGQDAEELDGYCHPHVNDGSLCLGDASEPFLDYLSCGEVCEALQLVDSVLRTYNPASAYASWGDGERTYSCDGCGRETPEEDIYSIGGEYGCPSCVFTCNNCGDVCWDDDHGGTEVILPNGETVRVSAYLCHSCFVEQEEEIIRDFEEEENEEEEEEEEE